MNPTAVDPARVPSLLSRFAADAEAGYVLRPSAVSALTAVAVGRAARVVTLADHEYLSGDDEDVMAVYLAEVGRTLLADSMRMGPGILPVLSGLAARAEAEQVTS